MSSIYYIFLVATFAIYSAYGAEFSLQESGKLSHESSLWKPTHIVKFSDDIFCFKAIDGSCTEGCPAKLLCSLEENKLSLSSVTVKHTFCGDRGVMNNGALFCPHEKKNSNEKDVLIYSSISFTPSGKGLDSSSNTGKEFRFLLDTSSSATNLIFNGNTKYIPYDKEYLMAATIVNDKKHSVALFRSVDGFSWRFVSTVPFGETEELYVTNLGGRSITVTSHPTKGAAQKVTSGYGGKWWSAVSYLNSSVLPFAFNYPSGLRVEFAVTNSTPLSVIYFDDFAPQKKHSLSLYDEENNLISSSQAVGLSLESADQKFILFIYDREDDGKKTLHYSKYLVDDSQESERREKSILREAKRREAKKEALLRVRREKAEKIVKEKEERLQKDMERRDNFTDMDSPNVELARENMNIDGELIIVREVIEEFVDLEKEFFFN